MKFTPDNEFFSRLLFWQNLLVVDNEFDRFYHLFVLNCFVFNILLGPLINSQFKWFNGQRGGMNVRVLLIAFSKIFVLWSCLLIKLNVVHRRCHTMVRFMFMMLLIIPDRQPLTAIVSLILTQTEIVKWIRNSDWWQDFFCLSFTCHRIHIIIIVTNGNEIFFLLLFRSIND